MFVSRLATALPVVCVLGFSGGAMAQKAGSYEGSTPDGGYMSFTVAGSSGDYSITTMNVNFVATCNHPSGTASEGWGFSLYQTIVPGVNDFHSANDYYDIVGTLRFPNKNTVKGTIQSRTAVFVPGSSPPTAAYFCKTVKESFTLTYQGPAKAPLVHNAMDAVVHKNQ